MNGFLRRIGCLVIIILICVAAWYWYARVPASKSTTTTTVETATSTNSGWQPLTAADADRGRAAVQSLGSQAGAVFAIPPAREAPSYISPVLAKQPPPSAKNAQAAIVGDRLYVRS